MSLASSSLGEERQNSSVIDVTAAAAHVTAGFSLGAVDSPLLGLKCHRATGKLIGWSLSGQSDSPALAGALQRRTSSPPVSHTHQTHRNTKQAPLLQSGINKSSPMLIPPLKADHHFHYPLS